MSRTFVELADSLVEDFDIIELLTVLSDRCAEVLEAGATGILLADPGGTLRVIAATSEQAWLLELFQLQNDEGPCFDSFVSGAPVVNKDVFSTPAWARFAPELHKAAFRSVHAFPLRLRHTVIGVLNVFLRERPDMDGPDQLVAQALADVATIAVLQHRSIREAETVSAQLQEALNSRVAVEQAKGVLAERAGVDMDEAFSRLRQFARGTNQRLSDIAAAVVNRSLPVEDVDRLVQGGVPRGPSA
ncbi:MAG TPA: ANTAR domain-containing protein [Acidimicrobiales bacterium]|nr:ANTAR domain-containing protein [Acidimicrobiales bacterium]